MARTTRTPVTPSSQGVVPVITDLEVAPRSPQASSRGKTRQPARQPQETKSSRTKSKASPAKARGTSNGKKSSPAPRGRQTSRTSKKQTPAAEVGVSREQLEAIRQRTQQVAAELQEVRQALQAARAEAEVVKAQSRQALEEMERGTQCLASVRQDTEEASQLLRSLSEQGAQARQVFREAEEAAQAAREQLVRAKEELEQISRRPRPHVVGEALPVAQPLSVPLGELETAPEACFPGGEPSPSAEVLVSTTVTPAEDAGERLIRYLNDAWAVEKGLVSTLRGMIEEVTYPEVRTLLLAYAELSHDQQQRLEQRLRELGKRPSGGKGFFDQMLTRLWDAMSRPRDEADQTLQHLLKGLGAGHFQIAMYQALAAYATVVEDGETVQLASEHRLQEADAIEQLRPFLTLAVAQAASTPES